MLGELHLYKGEREILLNPHHVSDRIWSSLERGGWEQRPNNPVRHEAPLWWSGSVENAVAEWYPNDNEWECSSEWCECEICLYGPAND